MPETFEAYRTRLLSYLGDEEPVGVQQATPSPAPRPPSALRSRRLTTFQVQDAGSTPRAPHRAVDARAGRGWLVGHRWAPPRQDSPGLGFGMLRKSLPSVLSVDCVCRRTLFSYRLGFFSRRTPKTSSLGSVLRSGKLFWIACAAIMRSNGSA